MAVKVYLGGAPAARGEITYEEADTFSVTAGGFLLIQRQHSGAQKDLAVFAPNAWLRAEVVWEPRQVRADPSGVQRVKLSARFTDAVGRGLLADERPVGAASWFAAAGRKRVRRCRAAVLRLAGAPRRRSPPSGRRALTRTHRAKVPGPGEW